MNIKKFISKNIGLKITAVLIALIVWINAVLNREIQVNYTCRIQFTNTPDSLVLIDLSQDHIDVVMRGKSNEFLLMAVLKRPVIAELNMGDYNIQPNKRVTAYIDNTAFKMPLDNSIEIEKIRDKEIIFALDSITKKSVPIMPVLENSPANGYMRFGEIVYTPEKITISGGKALLENIFHIETEPVNLEGATKSFTVKTRIKDKYKYINIGSDEISISIPVDKIVRKEFNEIPVEFINLPKNYLINSDAFEFSVEIEGPRMVVDNILSGELAPIIDLSSVKRGINKIPLSLNYENIKVINMNPDTLQIMVE